MEVILQFVIGVAAKVLEWLLMLGGQYLYEKTVEFVEKQKQKKLEEENLKKYRDAEKKGSKDDILEKERDLING
jgi:predicted DNA repair protein MutK